MRYPYKDRPYYIHKTHQRRSRDLQGSRKPRGARGHPAVSARRAAAHTGVKTSFHLIHSRPVNMADAGPVPEANSTDMAVSPPGKDASVLRPGQDHCAKGAVSFDAKGVRQDRERLNALNRREAELAREQHRDPTRMRSQHQARAGYVAPGQDDRGGAGARENRERHNACNWREAYIDWREHEERRGGSNQPYRTHQHLHEPRAGQDAAEGRGGLGDPHGPRHLPACASHLACRLRPRHMFLAAAAVTTATVASALADATLATLIAAVPAAVTLAASQSTPAFSAASLATTVAAATLPAAPSPPPPSPPPPSPPPLPPPPSPPPPH